MTNWVRRLRTSFAKSPKVPSSYAATSIVYMTPAFDIKVRRVGTKVKSQDGHLLGLPLTGPGDKQFVAEMAEIRQMETDAEKDASAIRLG